ncbi:family 43 glycosylhydrolase [Chloroflexota bacterium]
MQKLTTRKSIIKYIIILSTLIFSSLIIDQGNDPALARYSSTCEKKGWFPSDFGLKDHHVFIYDGYYYLISIYVPPGTTDPLLQDRFAYARSLDLCNWEDLTPVLPDRMSGSWDESAIWAPYVYQENGIYYLYYTGVTRDFTQSILLATSSDPSDPESWEKQEQVFQPNHPGMIWQDGKAADCRDPTVIKQGDVYHMYYAGRDQSGSIIGLATAPSPMGPWTDWGTVVSPEPDAILESPTIAQFEGFSYLFFTRSTVGGFYRIGASPSGPWRAPVSFNPGWAHEIWQDMGGKWFTSFLTNLTVTIEPLSWDKLFNPPRPFIGSTIVHTFIPLLTKP